MEVLLKYPKNIRQVGEIGTGKRIYVEDYVMTLVRQLAPKAGEGYGSAVLLGHRAMGEGGESLFISGAIELPQNWKQPEIISNVQWTFVYDQIQKYFHDTEILGLFLTRSGMDLSPDDKLYEVWKSGFDGNGKVLLLYDGISREDAFYFLKEGEFIRQSGYYIYYEKNEEMQNYMIDARGGESSDAGYEDTASQKIRQKFSQKKEWQKRSLFHQQAAYTLGILAGAVILVTAAGGLGKGITQETFSDDGEEAEAVSERGWLFMQQQEDAVQTQATETGQTETEKENEGKGVDGESVKEENMDGEGESENTVDAESGNETSSDKKNTGEDEENENDKQEEDTKETMSASGETNIKETDTQKTETKNNEEKTTKKKKKKRYEVKQGDTLESISIACYGTGSYVKKIKKINQLEDADKIYIGQILILP